MFVRAEVDGFPGTTMLKKGDHPYWKTSAYQNALNSSSDIVIIMLGKQYIYLLWPISQFIN